MATKSPRNESAARRRKVTKFALAGVAIVGVGAGLTSAAWTDNVWFGGTAESGNISIEGSIDGDNWFPSNDAGDLQIPASVFQGLTPNDEVTTTLYLRNAGQGSLDLEDAVITTDGPLFTFEGVDPTTELSDGTFAEVTAESLDSVVLTGLTAHPFDVTLTTPNWEDDAKNDGTMTASTFTITVQAST